MRILVDMDGIVADLWSPWLAEYNHLYDDTLALDNVDTWHVCEIVKCSESEMMDIIRRPGWFYALQPLPGAIDAVKSLIGQGHEIRFCTAPCTPHSGFEKRAWLLDYFGEEAALDAFVCRDKSWIQADLIIDDKPETLAAWNGFSATIEYPYNAASAASCIAESFREPIKAWAHILRFIDILEKTPTTRPRFHTR